MNLDYVFIRHQFTPAAMLQCGLFSGGLACFSFKLAGVLKLHTIVINIICRLTCIYTREFLGKPFEIQLFR